MKGFFSSLEITDTLRTPLTQVPACGSCGLLTKCHSPQMPVWGKGHRKILIVGEAPGAEEDSQNRPFCGKTGQFLERRLASFGVDLYRDCWSTNALRCRPPRNKITDDRMIGYCRPNLLNTIEELKPEAILLLGKSAIRSLIGWLWKEDVGAVERWIGFRIPSQKLDAWVCPIWHPSFVLRGDHGTEEADRRDQGVRERMFRTHLRNACNFQGRPWNTVPDCNSGIRTFLDASDAIDPLEQMLREAELQGDSLSFDYETNRLKPDHPEARILCASISNGRSSLAFPLEGKKIRDLFRDFLVSPIEKVGYNIRFEERWSRRFFGVKVRKWIWDGMLAAHVLDSRKHIKSLKFQAFALLGFASYDDLVKPYMQSETGNSANRLEDAPRGTLLRYCALDSLLEWQIADRQRGLFS